MAQETPLAISVIICTHNGARRLQAAVESLLGQSYDPGNFEVLIVDNDSDDDTAEVARRLIDGNPGRGIRYIFEKERGLSNARNTGIRGAWGEIVAFMDDDALAEANWLLNIERMFQDAGVQAIGGRVLPVFEVPRPPWLYKDIESALTILDLGDKVVPFEYPYRTPYGTNMAYRKKVFEDVGYFDAALGRSGRSLLSGEETDLFLRIMLKGHAFIYAPDCVVHHHVPEGRMRKSFFRRRMYYQGLTAAYMSLKFSSLAEVLVRDFKLLFGKKEQRSGKEGGVHAKGFFRLEVRFIFYLGYVINMIRFSLWRPVASHKGE